MPTKIPCRRGEFSFGEYAQKTIPALRRGASFEAETEFMGLRQARRVAGTGARRAAAFLRGRFHRDYFPPFMTHPHIRCIMRLSSAAFSELIA
jgi:hypothetical protein